MATIPKMKITKADFSMKSVPNDSALKDFQMVIKGVSGKQKEVLEALQNALADFFKNEKSKPTTEAQEAELATRLCNSLIKNINDLLLNNDKNTGISNNKNFQSISDEDKKKLEKYIKKELEDLKINDSIKESIEKVTFTEQELESFKTKVLEKTKETFSEQIKEFSSELLTDIFDKAKNVSSETSEFLKKHGSKIETSVKLPTINFLEIETRVINSIKKKIEKLKEEGINFSQRQQTNKSSMLIRGSSISNIFKKKKENQPVSFADAVSRINKFWLKHPLRQIKKTIKDWGKRFAVFVGKMFDYFLPITELLVLGKIVSNVVRFSFKLVEGLKNVFSTIWNFSKMLFRNTIGLLFKVFDRIRKSTFAKITTELFRSFFRSYIGAYLLGFAIGFIYGKIKEFMPKIKEKWQKFLEYIQPVLAVVKDVEETIEKYAKNVFFSVEDIILQIDAYITEGEDKSLSDGIDNVMSNLRTEDGKKIFSDKGGIFENIVKACEWIEKTVTITNTKKLAAAAQRAVAGMTLDFLGSLVGAKIGALLGSALGPAGTIAGGIIGSFIGGSIRSFLFSKDKKLVSVEADYDKYLRLKYNRRTQYSSAERMFQTDDGEYDTTTPFGYVLDVIKQSDRKLYETGEELELNEEQIEKLRSAGITLQEKDGKTTIDHERIPEELRYLENLSEENIIAEINSATTYLNYLNNPASAVEGFYGTYGDNYREFASTEASDESRQSILALNESGMYQFPKSANNFTDRAVVLHRIYRAMALRNLLRSLYMNQISPKNFIDIYRRLNKVVEENGTYKPGKNNNDLKQDFLKAKSTDRIPISNKLANTLNEMGDTHKSSAIKAMESILAPFKLISATTGIIEQRRLLDELSDEKDLTELSESLDLVRGSLEKTQEIREKRTKERKQIKFPNQKEENPLLETTRDKIETLDDLAESILEDSDKIVFDSQTIIAMNVNRNQPRQQMFLTGPLADSGQVQPAI